MDTIERFRRETSLFLTVFSIMVALSWVVLTGIFRALSGRWWWQ